MSQHVLVIGEVRVAHVRLKDLGARLTLMIASDRIKPEDAGAYDRILALPPAAPAEEWVATARTLHELDPVHAIGGFHERVQDKAAMIAEALQVRFHPVAVIAATRFKDAMRERLRAAGVDPTENRRVAMAQEIEAFAATHGYPVILKPVDGQASTGVSLIRRTEDIPAAIAWFQEWAPAHAMCVEEYLAGEEFSVEAFSENGSHQILSITRKYKETTHFVEVGHCMPAQLDEITSASVCCLVRRALTALGMEYGPSHTEVMVTADGPRIVETHVRPGGDCIPELLKIVRGVDIVDLWVRQALGEPVLHCLGGARPEHPFAAVWYGSPRAIGTMERIEGEEQARMSPGVMKVEVLQGPGTELVGTHDSFSRAACAIAVGDSPDEALERAQEATKKLRFVVACQA